MPVIAVFLLLLCASKWFNDVAAQEESCIETGEDQIPWPHGEDKCRAESCSVTDMMDIPRWRRVIREYGCQRFGFPEGTVSQVICSRGYGFKSLICGYWKRVNDYTENDEISLMYHGHRAVYSALAELLYCSAIYFGFMLLTPICLIFGYRWV